MIVRTRRGAVGLDEAGSGEPFLLLHGFPHDRTLWAPQLSAPAPGVRYLAPDLPGFGESERHLETALEDWADWLAALLDTLAIPRAIVGGLSMGGYLAFAFWRRHPQRVRALVLADTKAGADTEEGREKRRAMQELVRREGVGAVVGAMLPGMVGKTTRAARPEVVSAVETMMLRASTAGVIDALEALLTRPDSTPTLGTITVPTLVVCGEEDALTPVAESRAMHAAISGSSLGIIPGAGHVSNLEDPAGFNGLLSGFLTATIRRTLP